MSNPYAELARTMRESAGEARPAGLCLGRITAVGQGVLEIRADNGLELDGDDLLVNVMLRHDTPEAQAHEITAGGVSLGVNRQVPCLAKVGPYDLTGITLYDLPGELSGALGTQATVNRLAVGDRVLMVSIHDGQRYVVLCKVVSV